MKLYEQNIYSQYNTTNFQVHTTPSTNSPSIGPKEISETLDKSANTANSGEIIATLETGSHIRDSHKNAILYKREQINPAVRSGIELAGTKINPAEHYKNMLRTESESKTANTETITDEQMDLFLKKAFRLFNSPNPFL